MAIPDLGLPMIILCRDRLRRVTQLEARPTSCQWELRERRSDPAHKGAITQAIAASVSSVPLTLEPMTPLRSEDSRY